MSLYKLTKEQLIANCKRLQSENERLQSELNDLSDCYTEIENQWADAVNKLDGDNMIKNIDWFMFKLNIEGLLTPELKSFIEDYLKYYNEGRGEKLVF